MQNTDTKLYSAGLGLAGASGYAKVFGWIARALRSAGASAGLGLCLRACSIRCTAFAALADRRRLGHCGITGLALAAAPLVAFHQSAVSPGHRAGDVSSNTRHWHRLKLVSGRLLILALTSIRFGSHPCTTFSLQPARRRRTCTTVAEERQADRPGLRSRRPAGAHPQTTPRCAPGRY